MRDYGSGTIIEVKTKSGLKYKAALPAATTGGSRRWRTFKTRAEAEEALRDVEESGLEVQPGPTVANYGSRWLSKCKHRSVADDVGRWRLHVATSALGAMPLVSVQPRHIRAFLDALREKRRQTAKKNGRRGEHALSRQTVGRQTVVLTFGLLRRCFGAALLDGVLTVNPCAGVKLRQRAGESPIRYLTAAEVEQLLNSARVPLGYRLVYEVAIFTGLRQGELWALRWSDIDFKGKRVTAASSYAGPTKADKVRRFPLLPRAERALMQWRTLTKSKDLVFPGRRNIMHAKGYDAQFVGRFRELAGLPPTLTFHSFRHTCATHLLAGTWGPKWSPAEVCRFLDHSSITVTMRYARVVDTVLDDLAARTTG